jgi:MFS transporter, OFA family, oxalate/formate antiporter
MGGGLSPLHLIPALVGWCFGVRAFGEIYAMMMTAFGLGTVMGPLLGGWLHDALGSYGQVPLCYLVGILCAATLLSLIRKYPGQKTASAKKDRSTES